MEGEGAGRETDREGGAGIERNKERGGRTQRDTYTDRERETER